MKPRTVIPRQVSPDKLKNKTEPKDDICLINTKLFLKKQLGLIAGEKVSNTEKIQTSSKLATRVKALLDYENSTNPVTMMRNVSDVLSSHPRLSGALVVKADIEKISEECWLKSSEVHSRYLIYFLMELHRYKMKSSDSLHDAIYLQAAICLNTHSLAWANEAKSWAKAYENDVLLLSSTSTGAAIFAGGLLLFAGVGVFLTVQSLKNACFPSPTPGKN